MGTGDFVQLIARYIYIQTFMLLFDTPEYFLQNLQKSILEICKGKS